MDSLHCAEPNVDDTPSQLNERSLLGHLDDRGAAEAISRKLPQDQDIPPSITWKL